MTVPVKAAREEGVRSVDDLASRIRAELEHFFTAAVAFEAKELRILDWAGPLVTTSTTNDNLTATMRMRQRRGEVFVFDPQNLSGVRHTVGIDPIAGCEDPLVAVQRGADVPVGGAHGVLAPDQNPEGQHHDGHPDDDGQDGEDGQYRLDHKEYDGVEERDERGQHGGDQVLGDQGGQVVDPHRSGGQVG